MTARFLSSLPTATSAMAGTLPLSARFPQVSYPEGATLGPWPLRRAWKSFLLFLPAGVCTVHTVPVCVALTSTPGLPLSPTGLRCSLNLGSVPGLCQELEQGGEVDKSAPYLQL